MSGGYFDSIENRVGKVIDAGKEVYGALPPKKARNTRRNWGVAAYLITLAVLDVVAYGTVCAWVTWQKKQDLGNLYMSSLIFGGIVLGISMVAGTHFYQGWGDAYEADAVIARYVESPLLVAYTVSISACVIVTVLAITYK